MERYVIKAVCSIVILVLCGLSAPCVSLAQRWPDAGTILREMKEKPALPERKPDVTIEPRPDVSVAEIPGPKVLVKGFRIKGATIFKEEMLLTLLQEYLDKEVTFSGLQKAAEKITAYYIARGYIVRVYLPPQEIKEGIVELAVIEGRLEDVVLDKESKSRLDFQRAKKYLTASQGIGEPVHMDRLERGMLILTDLPGVAASSTLQPGTQEGMIQQSLRLAPIPFITGSIDLDNAGSRAAGAYRVGVGIDFNNPANIGDRISIKAIGGFEDSLSPNTKYGRITYSLPVGYRGLRLGASFAAMDYRLGAHLEDPNADGHSTIYNLFVSYPIIRQRKENLFVIADYNHKRLKNEFNRTTTSNKKIDAVTIGLNGNLIDNFLGGGYTSLDASFIMGRLDLDRCRADRDADRLSARTHGGYKKATLNLYRIQRLAEKTSLSLSLTRQFAFKNLDSSEDFSLGGPYGVRAYPTSEASGDEGTLLAVEIQQRLTQNISAFAFYDYGHIKTNHKKWTTTNIPNSYHLEGIGGGIAYIKPANFYVKITLAGRLGKNPGRDASGDDSDGTKRNPRIWVMASKYF